MRKLMLALAAVAATLALAGTATAAPSTPPGGDAAYQVEISSNLTGPNGGGIWLWLELDKNHTGIYAGSDCGNHRAASDHGPLTWQQVGDQLVISGVRLNDLPPFASGDVIVPAGYGHYTKTIVDVFPNMAGFFGLIGVPLDAGFSQVQVAP